jgi:DNA-binding IclR family transcriptional regulator
MEAVAEKLAVEKSEEVKNTDSRYQPVVPAVEQAIKTLLFMAQSPNPKMKLTEICNHVGIYKSKGFSILHTLAQYGFIDKDPRTKTYSLGPSLLYLSRYFLDHLSYPDAVAPFLEGLNQETGATSLFGLINGSHVIVLAERGNHGNIGLGVRLGQRFHLTLGAHGKAIAAFLPEAEREALFSKKKLHFYGDPSRLDMNRLNEELEKCRESGFACDMGMVTPGVTIISSPVFGPGENLIGCVMAIGTCSEDKVREVGPKVANTARLISQRLGAQRWNGFSSESEGEVDSAGPSGGFVSSSIRRKTKI